MDEQEEINPFSAPQEFNPEPTPAAVAPRGPQGIGGWLILVALGHFVRVLADRDRMDGGRLRRSAS